jgi:hypothetical protein
LRVFVAYPDARRGPQARSDAGTAALGVPFDRDHLQKQKPRPALWYTDLKSFTVIIQAPFIRRPIVSDARGRRASDGELP